MKSQRQFFTVGAGLWSVRPVGLPVTQLLVKSSCNQETKHQQICTFAGVKLLASAGSPSSGLGTKGESWVL